MYLAHQARFHSDRFNLVRVRGLVVEDAAGRERILIGAPVPAVKGRKRRDDSVGFIVLGENGADRVTLTAPMPEPQSGESLVHESVGELDSF
jgi:hypothetical protein